MAGYYLDYFNKEYNKDIGFTDDLIDKICRLQWKGNVRELQNYVERMVIINEDFTKDANAKGDVRLHELDDCKSLTVNCIMPLNDALEETEKQLFKLASKYESSSYGIARLLHTSQSNAYRKAKKYIGTIKA